MTTRVKPSSAIIYLLSGILVLLFILTLFVGAALFLPSTAPLHGYLYPSSVDAAQFRLALTAQEQGRDWLSTQTANLLETKTP